VEKNAAVGRPFSVVPSSPTSSPSATAVLGDFLPAQLWAPPLLPAGRKAGDF